MSFSGMKEWICDLLCFPCTTSLPHYEFFRPFYNTFCFVNNVVCDASHKITNTDHKLNFAEHPFQEITTISATAPPSVPCSDKKCAVVDYFDIWLNETSSNVFSQATRKKLYQKGFYSNWYDVFSYAKLWWSEAIKGLYYFANSMYENMHLNPDIYDEKPQSISRIGKNTETEVLPNDNFFHILLLYCTIGGICLIVFLLYRKSIESNRRKRNLTTELDIKEFEAKIVQKLIKVLEETKAIDKKLGNEFKANFFKFTEAMESLENKQNNKIKLNNYEGDREILTNQEITEKAQCKRVKSFRDLEQISKLEKQCKVYQQQTRFLEEQLHDLLKNHRAEVKNYFAENRKIQLELGKTQNRLDLSQQLHKTETEHLNQYIAQLQAQYENSKECNRPHLTCELQNVQSTEKDFIKPNHNPTGVFNKPPPVIAHLKAQFGNNNEFNKHYLACRHSLQDTQKNLKSIEACIKQQPDLTEILKKPLQLQAQYKNTSEFSLQHLTNQHNFQDTQKHLQATEDFSVKTERNFATAVVKTLSPVETCYENIKCEDKIKQTKTIYQQDPHIVESLYKIEQIFQNTKKLRKQVKEFVGSRDDETYLNLKETLIEHAIKLNNVNCENHSVLKKKSKTAWKCINKCRNVLESKIR